MSQARIGPGTNPLWTDKSCPLFDRALDWVHSIGSWLRRGGGARASASSVVCWGVYLETDTPEGPQREMVGIYSSETEAQDALAIWEVELTNFSDAHARRAGSGNCDFAYREPARSQSRSGASRARVSFAPVHSDERPSATHRRG